MYRLQEGTHQVGLVARLGLEINDRLQWKVQPGRARLGQVVLGLGDHDRLQWKVHPGRVRPGLG
jgi:hypothetical protein